jgi:predicted kinase
VVRKELSAVGPPSTAPLYSTEGKEQIYEECHRRAREGLMKGGRVIVDATFQHDDTRQRFLKLAIECGVRGVWIECTAPAEVTHRRLDARNGDASDADWSVYQLVASQWDRPTELTSRFHAIVNTGGDTASALAEAAEILKRTGLSE